MKILIKENAAADYMSGCRVQGRYVPTEHERKFYEILKQVQGRKLTVDRTYLFDDQFNTKPIPGVSESGVRIMQRQVEDVIDDIRHKFCKCGYCENQQPISDQVFCDRCLDSAYLKTDDLHLLRLKPIMAKHKGFFTPLTEQEREFLLPLYTEAQTTGTNSRAVAKRNKQRERVLEQFDKVTENATIERDGMLWLWDNGVSLDNVIYYNHTRTFSFGWRSGLSDEVASVLCTQLQGFPFNYEIKKG